MEINVQTTIEKILYRLSVFYTPEEAWCWLHAKHPTFNNERAVDLIDRGEIQDVLAAIDILDCGAYV
jgi:hypothetical protein